MVKCKNHGKQSKTRYKTTKRKRERGLVAVTLMLKEFRIGDRVHVRHSPSVRGGAPFRRFVGKTGVVVGRQGVCYLVKIQDQHAEKQAVIHPAHLLLQK